MEYVNDIINRVKGLSALDKYKVITQLSETFDIERLSLDELLLLSNDTLAIKGHRLNMKVEGKSIYGHLQIFKKHLIERYSENTTLKAALPDLTQKIKRLKLYSPLINEKEQNKNIKDRTIITGNQKGNKGGSTKIAVPDLTYVREEEFIWEARQIKHYIEEIAYLGLRPDDAARLFVLIAGLPKAGFQNAAGERHGVGGVGQFAYFTPLSGEVDFLHFYDDYAYLGHGIHYNAMPAFSNY